MPSKRPNPVEDPPSASPTDDDDDDDDDASSEEEEVESDEEEDSPLPPPSLKTPNSDSTPNTPNTITNSASESDEDSDSDDEESPENPQPIRTVANVKPIATKPMIESPAKPKNSTTTITTTAKLPTTRALMESDKEDKGDKQQKKKKKVEEKEEEDGGPVEETEKKSGRVWSEEDEIVILKGMASLVKKGKNPSARSDELFDTIKDSLSTEATRNQLLNKIPRLKQKYQQNVSRSKNGEDPAFSKLIDQKAYQLGKKIWGNTGAKDGEAGKGIGVEGNSSGGSHSLLAGGNKSKSLKSSNGLASPRPKVLSFTENVEAKGEDQDLFRYPSLYSVARDGKEFGDLPFAVKDLLSERCLSLLSSSKKSVLEGKWKKMRDEEVDLYFRKMDLVRETTNEVKVVINSQYR